jgi:hypothetical protein
LVTWVAVLDGPVECVLSGDIASHYRGDLLTDVSLHGVGIGHRLTDLGGVKLAQGFLPGTKEANENTDSFTSVISDPQMKKAAERRYRLALPRRSADRRTPSWRRYRP